MPNPHITELYAENVKRLRVVRITPDGAMVQIAGPNGSGKSSVLDAIYWALAGKSGIEPQPVRRGSDRALIKLTLGDVVITREIQPDGKSTLTVEAASGARFPSPQRMLDDLLGTSALTFDPLAFDRMKPKEQLLELQKVAPLPADVLRYREIAQRTFEERTQQKRELRDLEGRIRASGAEIPPGLTLEDCALEDTRPILDRMAAISLNAEKLARERSAREAQRGMVTNLEAQAADMRDEAKRLLAAAEDLDEKVRGITQALDKLEPLPAPVDATEVRAELERVESANAARARMRAALGLERQRAQLEADIEASTIAIRESEAEVERLIGAAPMPVEGLAYGAEGVLFNGLPLEQASGAERLRVALGIAMANQPKLRVVRIKDGSLLDERSLALVAELAAARDYQVWIERVDTSGTVGVVMQDGEVVQGGPNR